MSLPRLTSLWMIAVVAAACDTDSIGPPFSLANAAAMADCVGALGEPGIAIFLGPVPVQPLTPSEPYVHITIQQPLASLTERSWGVNGSGDQAHASYHATATDAEIATSGVVTVNVVAPDNTIEGAVDLDFPSGRVRGEFRALWYSRPPFGCI